MPGLNDAANQVALVPLHAGQGDVGGSGTPRAIEPQRHMRKCRPLVLVHRPSVAEANWVVDAAAVGDCVIGVPVDAQAAVGDGADHDAAGPCVEVLNRGDHAVHEMLRLVEIARKSHARATVEDELGGKRGAGLDEPAPDVIVLRVLVVLDRDLPQGSLTIPLEQHLCSQRVQQGRPASSARDESRLTVGAVQDTGDVHVRGLVVPSPGLVFAAEQSHQLLASLPHRLVGADGRLLAGKHRALAPLDFVELDLEHVLPGPVRVGRLPVDGGQLLRVPEQQ